MKLIVTLLILSFSSLSFSEVVFVKKTLANAGVTQEDAESVREAVQNAVTAQGHTLGTTLGQAQWTLRAVVSKAEKGPYIVKIERTHAGKLVGSNHGSDGNLNEATRLATINLVEAMGKVLPEKTIVTNNTVAPGDYAQKEMEEHREVAAAGPTNDASVVETKHPNYVKNWLVAIGPVLSNNLVTTSGQSGTKFGINLAYTEGLSEYWNLQIMYDGSFNTVATGSTNVSSLNVGVEYFLWDRLTSFSPWVSFQVGYGGGNRTSDATEIGTGAIGVDFLRTQTATYTVYLRNATMYASDGRSLANWPNITQLMVGINF